MSDADVHTGHVEAGAWDDTCALCAEATDVSRRIEIADDAHALLVFAAVPLDRREEVLRRLAERNQIPTELLDKLRSEA